MNTVIHRADKRGLADHGWLKSFHSFSFASYYNPQMMGFGSLRVLNDDLIEPLTGFGTHPHQNMEIITIILSGSIKHEDSQGNKSIINPGDVQIMSAGTGVTHSEFSNDPENKTNFLQIWIMPRELNISPRYDQARFDVEDRKNKLQLVVSPINESYGGIKINQNAYFSLSHLEEGNNIEYKAYDNSNMIYVFLVEGSVEFKGERLGRRDALGLESVDTFELNAKKDSQILIMEIPPA